MVCRAIVIYEMRWNEIIIVQYHTIPYASFLFEMPFNSGSGQLHLTARTIVPYLLHASPYRNRTISQRFFIVGETLTHTHTHPPVQFMNHYYRSVFVHSHNISDSSQIGFVFYHRQIHHNRIVLCQISKEKNQKEPRQHFPFFGPIWIVSNSKAHKNGMRQAALFASFRHRIASSVFLLAYIRPRECFFPQILLEYM